MVIGGALVIAAAVGEFTWPIAIGAFLLIVALAVWLIVRSGRSMQKSLQQSEGKSSEK